MDERIDVRSKYSREIMEINNKLNQLEKGRVYDITGAQMDGYLSTNIDQLRGMINNLILKIEFNEEGDHARLREAYDKFHGE